MTSNRADAEATRPFVIGPCTCPGTPHAEDTADLRVQYGYGEIGRIRQAYRVAGVEAMQLAMLEIGVVRWNLVKADGSVRDVSLAEIELLSEAVADRLCSLEGLQAAFGALELPNPSAAPSPDGSQESGSPTPTTPAPSASTST